MAHDCLSYWETWGINIKNLSILRNIFYPIGETCNLHIVNTNNIANSDWLFYLLAESTIHIKIIFTNKTG